MSDQDNSVFGGEPTSQPTEKPVEKPTEPTQPQFTLPEEASELIGEGKKYASIEEALKALPHAQKHIETLEADNATLRAKTEQSASLEETVAGLVAKVNQTSRPETPVHDPKELTQTILSVINQKSDADLKQANLNAADNFMLSTYGDKRFDVMQKAAESLNVTTDFLKLTAERSPKAFEKLVKDSQDGKGYVPPTDTSTLNSEALKHKQPDAPSIKVGHSPNTKNLKDAWRAAREKVQGEQ